MKKQKIVVLRFSSLGDVAMTVPVIKEVLLQNPQIEIVFFTRKEFLPLFKNIHRCTCVGLDLNGEYKGAFGIQKIVSLIKKEKPIGIADLHNVLRTQIIKKLLAFTSIKIASLQKGREEKKALTSKKDKVLKPLFSMHQRYAEVFNQLGYSIELKNELKQTSNHSIMKIGFAPFAKYKEKMLPMDTSKKLALYLAEKGKKIIVFGGGKNEEKEIELWEKLHPNIHSMVRKYSFEKELEVISTLDLMISMDSANMHLASVYGVRVISVWGATHPFAGFLGYGQKMEDCVQIDMYCRPCSVFGNKKCYRNDWKCLADITVEMIADKIKL